MPCISCMFQKKQLTIQGIWGIQENIINALYASYVSKK
jgi:hypothetical protein